MAKAKKKVRRGNAVTRNRQVAAKKEFLKAIAEVPNITAACRVAKIDRKTAYNYRDADAAFAEAWEDALEAGVDTMEIEAHRRAVMGIDKPIYWKDQQIDTLKEYSDTLMIFLLKAHRPDKYRERVDHNHIHTISQIQKNMQQNGIDLDKIRKIDPALANHLAEIGVA